MLNLSVYKLRQKLLGNYYLKKLKKVIGTEIDYFKILPLVKKVVENHSNDVYSKAYYRGLNEALNGKKGIKNYNAICQIIYEAAYRAMKNTNK
jgi:hypothetical protein